jgi:hypothetical protein
MPPTCPAQPRQAKEAVTSPVTSAGHSQLRFTAFPATRARSAARPVEGRIKPAGVLPSCVTPFLHSLA